MDEMRVEAGRLLRMSWVGIDVGCDRAFLGLELFIENSVALPFVDDRRGRGDGTKLKEAQKIDLVVQIASRVAGEGLDGKKWKIRKYEMNEMKTSLKRIDENTNS